MTASAGRGQPSGSTARTHAQAKVNLVLRVLARETSGYHQLETLFCRLELGDDVVVRTNVTGRSLECVGDVIPSEGLGPTERNLAWRAAAAYAAATGWPNAWAIEITKRIPVGGGLGGGSADAGAVLRCLNALATEPLERSALLKLAASLGADVPFLTLEHALAFAWGRGERLLSLPRLPSRDVVLVTFPFGVPTADAYAWLDDSRADDVPQPVALDVEALTTWLGVSRLAHNDFEAIVSSRYADISHWLTFLRSTIESLHGRFSIVQLAGSGATVFLVALASPAPPMLGSHDPAVRIVYTRTAERVVAVEVEG